MQTKSSLPEPGFIFHTYPLFKSRAHEPSESDLIRCSTSPTPVGGALRCYRQLKKTEEDDRSMRKRRARRIQTCDEPPLGLSALPVLSACVCVCVCVLVCVCVGVMER